jgi:hypothetical protein
MKTLGIIHIDNMIDLITNSSSELYVIENNMAKTLLVEMLNEAFKGTNRKFNEFSIDNRFAKDKPDWELDVDDLLENFPESDREELRQRYFSTPRFYVVSFDRDYIKDDDRQKLYSIGFELIDSDY